MKSYPVWMNVTSCIYKNPKSYGVRNEGNTEIFVGNSAKNSHLFGSIRVTHRDMGEKGKSFRLYIDGEIIKEGVVHDGELFILLDRVNEEPVIQVNERQLSLI